MNGGKGLTNIIKTNDKSVLLLGLDFGSTTSSALIAKSSIVSNSISGNLELGDISVIYRSEISFTPFINETIDENKVQQLIQEWLSKSGYQTEDFFAGGVIITGLAAQKENAKTLTHIIEKQIGEILVATADDPNLESSLAFMGGCGALSRYHQEKPIVNIDIGGGTTNPAYGLNGKVLSTGCYYIGARHIQFKIGSYTITALTDEAKELFKRLNIHKTIGDDLSPDELECFIQCYVEALEQIALGNHHYFDDDYYAFLAQVSFSYPQTTPIAITFSGGIGELIYQAIEGEALPSTTYYGDLGIDLTKAILKSPILSQSLRAIVPDNKGRATVYGLALHSTEISGSTLYLPNPNILPLRHLPIIAQLKDSFTFDDIQPSFRNIAHFSTGACIQLFIKQSSIYQNDKLNFIRELGHNIHQLLKNADIPKDIPIVILVDCNVGKSLGSYATDWGRSDFNLIIIDEVSLKDANFVNINQLHQQIVPISFYGIK